MGCSWQPQWDELELEEQAKLLARQGHTYNGSRPRARRRRGDARRPARRRDGRRGGDARQQHHAPATTTSPRRPRRRSRAAGSTPATSRSGIPTATSSCATAPRTSSSRAARTSRASRSSRRSPAIRRSRGAVVAMPDEKWGERPKAFVELKSGEDAGEEELLEFCREHLAKLQVPRGGRVRRAAADVDRQDPEVRPARAGVGRAGEGDRMSTPLWRLAFDLVERPLAAASSRGCRATRSWTCGARLQAAAPPGAPDRAGARRLARPLGAADARDVTRWSTRWRRSSASCAS